MNAGTVGAVAAAGLLGVMGVSAVVAVDSSTQAEPIPACTLVTSRGQLADPCTVQPLAWTQSFKNGLSTMQYFPKWKAASPGDYGRLRTYAVSAPTTPQPTVNTAFGSVIRWSVEQCRMWAVNVTTCALP